MGPSMVAVLKEVYGRAKGADKFLMSQQPALKYSWNTMAVSSFWDMRLSIACAATEMDLQNRIYFHDNTLILHVVARQPHPDPNYAPHTARLLLTVAWRGSIDTPCPRSQEHLGPQSVLSPAWQPYLKPFCFFSPP